MSMPIAAPHGTPTPVLPQCRACGAHLTRTFVDLGRTPLANSYMTPGSAPEDEPSYPLHARVCDRCLLVQLDAVVPAEEIFSDYAYFSSYSDSWLAHCRAFADEAVRRWGLDSDALVMEVASNDGYLLQYFVASGIPVVGVEPAANVAAAAEARGVPTEVRFLGAASAVDVVARAGRRADLVVANNVLAHVPDLNDFMEGLSELLGPQGVLSIEFPHLLNLIEQTQFDTIYHEHFSYFSLYSAEQVLGRHGLRVFDVEQVPTHGGSLRLLVCHSPASHAEGEGLRRVRAQERDAGLNRIEAYAGFDERVRRTQASLTGFLQQARDEGRVVVAYGAAAKGNTLLNSCGVGTGDIAFAVDRNPHKQGTLLPGSRLPVHDPSRVDEARPDYLLILPWNIADEVMTQMSRIRDWGGKFVVPVPEVRVLP